MVCVVAAWSGRAGLALGDAGAVRRLRGWLRGGKVFVDGTRVGGGRPRRGGGAGADRAGLASRATSAASPPPASPAAGPGSRPRICVLGGGFGGLYTALRLEALRWPEGRRPEVTLIDKSDRFVFKPLLYELLNGTAQPEEVAPQFSELLGPTAVRFVRGRVREVEHAGTVPGSAGRVVLGDGTVVEYDWIVLALGSEGTHRGVPGAKDHALPFTTLEDTTRIKDEIQKLQSRGTPASIAVVGAGYAGVELAATVAEMLGSKGRVTVVAPDAAILPMAPGLQREEAERFFRKTGTETLLGTVVKAMRRKDEEGPVTVQMAPVSGAGGETTRDFDLVLWTAGQVPVRGPGQRFEQIDGPRMPFPTNAKGATETDVMLRVKAHPRAFAIGDVAADGGHPLPQTAQVAFQQADYAAWNLWASINNRPLLPFRYQHLGEMMSLGRFEGSVALAVPLPAQVADAVNASPLGSLMGMAGITVGAKEGGFVESGINVGGPLGAALRRAAYWYRQPTDTHKVRVGQSWVQQAVGEAVRQASTAGRS